MISQTVLSMMMPLRARYKGDFIKPSQKNHSIEFKMENLILFLEKWQTLLGSIIGGVFALFVALIVANKVKRNEEISSAMLIIGDLVLVNSAISALEELAKRDNISAQDYPSWITAKLTQQTCPKQSSLFEVSMARIMPVNPYLAAHLKIFKTKYEEIEKMLNNKSNNYNLIKKMFYESAKHADYAIYFLNKLVLSDFSTFNKIRMSIFSLSKEKESQKLLKTGEY